VTWRVGVAGTVHYDDVTTPHGRRTEQLGGSAVYFSLAASRFAPVAMASILGADADGPLQQALHGRSVDRGGVTVSELPTFRWRAVHDFERWVTSHEEYSEGADAQWTAQLAPAVAEAPVLFVGSMRPDLQLRVMEASKARLVSADSMTVFIGREHDLVMRAAEGADVLFLNRSELAALTGAPLDRWRESAMSLLGRGRMRAVVVKAGPLGAALCTAGGIVERPAHPVAEVIDPTGAGDALAGGFLGACARHERDDEEFMTTALEEGLRCAADAIGAFGVAGLVAEAAVSPDR
jgi:sugar/nucleoside kinase (ribokinase family)